MTALEWIEVCRPDLLEKYLTNVFEQKEELKLTKGIATFSDCMDRSFFWSNTKEGHKFWYNVSNNPNKPTKKEGKSNFRWVLEECIPKVYIEYLREAFNSGSTARLFTCVANFSSAVSSCFVFSSSNRGSDYWQDVRDKKIGSVVKNTPILMPAAPVVIRHERTVLPEASVIKEDIPKVRDLRLLL